jgi:hypothetical protein
MLGMAIAVKTVEIPIGIIRIRRGFVTRFAILSLTVVERSLTA